MMKCAIVGVSGGRAHGHAEAYQHIARGQLVAISTRRRDALDDFGARFGVDARYTDYREMFVKEKPDLVHVNTPPDVRLEVMNAAEEAGVPALIVEKPLAIQWEDYLPIREFMQRSHIKIAVNHQLHFHPRRMALQRLAADGALGELLFIDASSGMNMAYQGTHTLQAVGAFAGAARPVSVFAQTAGADGLQSTPRKHVAPDATQAVITYDSGLSALLRCGINAPRAIADERIHVHKRIAVYGTRGFCRWSMWSWRVSIDGQSEAGEHQYEDEDILGQAAMTEAMIDWLEDDRALHPLALPSACRDFETMLGIYTSGLRRQVVPLPAAPTDNLIQQMRDALTSE